MPKKTAVPSAPSVPALEWDRNNAEPWFCDFEKEPINDGKWTCIVTAAIQSQTRNEDCIQTYTHFASTGLRKAVKTISMADVVALLKENLGAKSKKDEESAKPGKTDKAKASEASFDYSTPQVVELVTKYATITDSECKLPPDLMAALVKFMILELKRESCFEKRVEAVRARKRRQQNIKARFIRNLKPYENIQESKSQSTTSSKQEVQERINDHPLDGPDLYIMLVDFYDVFCFPEMLRIHIPFVAILRITKETISENYHRAPLPSAVDPEANSRRSIQVTTFWKNLKSECTDLERGSAFKDIALMQYTAPTEYLDSKQHLRTIFDELTWMQYSAYYIYGQHQKYLQEMQVQRVILSLEPLDLSRCKVYNKLCDALITGEPLTPLMVLYAIVEQVVVGVPETKNTALEYYPKSTTFFSCLKKNAGKRKTGQKGITLMCESKRENVCPQKEKRESEGPEVFDCSEYLTLEPPIGQPSSKLLEKLTESLEYHISESLIEQVLSEKKVESDNKTEKKWKTPVLCYHGDSVFRQSFYCDPRLFDAEEVVRRFLANSDFFPIWNKYPELRPEEKAYFNYHFFSLWKISQQRQDLLKLKIFFTISARLMAVTKSYMYRGDDGNTSDVMSDGEKEKQKVSMMKFDKNSSSVREGFTDFYNYFFKTFIAELYSETPRKAVIPVTGRNRLSSSSKRGSQILQKTTDHLKANFYKASSRICEKGTGGLIGVKSLKTLPFLKQQEKGDATLSSLLECPEVTSLADSYLQPNNENYLNIIKSFKFYEKLEPNLMVQRLLEAGRHFNSFQCSHFLPTDSLVITMYDDFDQRGVFYTSSCGALSTPLALRDFYSYVYPEITEWLVNETSEHSKFVAELEEKVKAREDKEDEEYLEQLKAEYCKMNYEERKEFLETVVDLNSEPEVRDDELENLPNKPKPFRPREVTFIGTNFTDLRVEYDRRVHEFHSRDGTKIRVILDNWLYDPSCLLSLQIKRANLSLYYSQWLDQETNTAFTFKSDSDIIFSFYGNAGVDDAFKYSVSISWPTGLLIQPVRIDSTLYVKQGYLKSCGRGWKPEEEDSRCFLKNGQIIVFKSNGDYDVLCSSGTKYSFYDSLTTPKYEIISSTGDIWETRPKGPCRTRKKLITRSKVFIGVDPKTREVYYKRDDGTQCMLWPNGRLVTIFSDGTKITATPYFDDEEINVEWTSEEKLFIEELVQQFKSEQSVQEPRSRTILRNSSTTKGPEPKSVEFEGFLSVSCAYLMEHPKYSSVYFNPSDSYLKVTMPENLSILVHPEGIYEVQQDNHFLRVYNSGVEFQTLCNTCDDTSTVKLDFGSSETLCSFIDFFQKIFFVLRGGEISFQESPRESGETKSMESGKTEKSHSIKKCPNGHSKDSATNQRFFALERDLSGVEFLHEDCVARHASEKSGDTYHEQYEDEPTDVSHTFSTHYYTAGYESWLMNYEDPVDSLPVNIKKTDLKELGAKQVTKNLFQYPFPKNHTCGSQQPAEKVKNHNVNHKQCPKLIVTRTFMALPNEPNSVINEIHKYVETYQNRAQEVYKGYANRKSELDCSHDSRYVEMRLKKIALTLNQSLHMYPHLCTQLPSTEKDIHYFGHFINSAQEMKCRIPESLSVLPNCKQIPIPLPRSSEFPSIDEEIDSPKNKENS